MMIRLAALFSYFLLLTSLVGIIYPAFIDENVGFTDIVVSLFDPELTQAYAIKLLLVFLIICSSYVIIVSYYNRNRPVTVLHASIDIKVSGEDWSITDISGEYIIRANHPNITSYRTTHTPDFGSVSVEDIQVDAFSESHNIVSSTEISAAGSKAIEVIQTFDKPLPSKWYFQLIPASIISREYDSLPYFLRKGLVKRRVSVRYLNEHNVPLPAVRFRAPTYPHVSILVRFEFPSNAPPHGLVARRIKNSAVVNVPVDGNSARPTVRINNLAGAEMVRISWAKHPNA